MARNDDRPPTPLGSIHFRPRDLKWTRPRGTTDGTRRTPLGVAHGTSIAEEAPSVPAGMPAAPLAEAPTQPEQVAKPGARPWPWLLAVLAVACVVAVVLIAR